MPSCWIVPRRTPSGEKRYVVRYRLGGRESSQGYGGSFRTKAEAKVRRRWVEGELAALRVPDLHLTKPEPSPTVGEVAEKWRVSRIDVTKSTATTHKVNLGRILPTFRDRPIDTITAEEVAAFVGDLSLKRESVRKTLATFGMVFDFHGVNPNPVRDKRVKLPQEDQPEVNPPTAAHVLAVIDLVPTAYRLPILVLDATGMRVSEMEALSWQDVDEPERRWRVSRATSKTNAARWVPVPEALFEAVVELAPRDDRDLVPQVFDGFGADRLRTALARACKAAGVPAFSPHDLRHRRASLWHLQNKPPAEAASWLGHSIQEHLRTYAHVVIDRTEIDYAEVLESAATARSVRAPVHRRRNHRFCRDV